MGGGGSVIAERQGRAGSGRGAWVACPHLLLKPCTRGFLWLDAGAQLESSLHCLLDSAFHVPLWFWLLLSANSQAITLPWSFYCLTSCIFFATWQGNHTSQIAHNPWLSWLLLYWKKEASRAREWFLEQRGTFSNKNTGTSYTPHPLSLCPGAGWILLAKRAAFPLQGENTAPLRAVGSILSFPWRQEQQEWSFLSLWLCAQSKRGVRGRVDRGEREGPGGPRRTPKGERPRQKPWNWRQQAFCVSSWVSVTENWPHV